MFEMLGDYVDERFYGCGCVGVSEGLGWKGWELGCTSAFSGGFMDGKFGLAFWIHSTKRGWLTVVNRDEVRERYAGSKKTL